MVEAGTRKSLQHRRGRRRRRSNLASLLTLQLLLLLLLLVGREVLDHPQAGSYMKRKQLPFEEKLIC
jgi:hypothetical protein